MSTIKATLKHVSGEQLSRFNNSVYKIFRFKDDNGQYYECTVSNDIPEWRQWIDFEKTGIDKVFIGMQLLGRKSVKGHELLNKRVVPIISNN